MELPFELYKNHKSLTKCSWKNGGLIITEEEFELIYNEYIYATNCDLCNKEFKTRKDRHMEHNHQTGEFRNIVCSSCNQKKTDVKKRTDNTSGYVGISKSIDEKCKQGFIWKFRAMINGKSKCIKNSVDFDKLVEFANKWKIDNNYHT